MAVILISTPIVGTFVPTFIRVASQVSSVMPRRWLKPPVATSGALERTKMWLSNPFVASFLAPAERFDVPREDGLDLGGLRFLTS